MGAVPDGNFVWAGERGHGVDRGCVDGSRERAGWVCGSGRVAIRRYAELVSAGPGNEQELLAGGGPAIG